MHDVRAVFKNGSEMRVEQCDTYKVLDDVISIEKGQKRMFLKKDEVLIIGEEGSFEYAKLPAYKE